MGFAWLNPSYGTELVGGLSIAEAIGIARARTQ